MVGIVLFWLVFNVGVLSDWLFNVGVLSDWLFIILLTSCGLKKAGLGWILWDSRDTAPWKPRFGLAFKMSSATHSVSTLSGDVWRFPGIADGILNSDWTMCSRSTPDWLQSPVSSPRILQTELGLRGVNSSLLIYNLKVTLSMMFSKQLSFHVFR